MENHRIIKLITLLRRLEAIEIEMGQKQEDNLLRMDAHMNGNRSSLTIADKRKIAFRNIGLIREKAGITDEMKGYHESEIEVARMFMYSSIDRNLLVDALATLKTFMPEIKVKAAPPRKTFAPPGAHLATPKPEKEEEGFLGYLLALLIFMQKTGMPITMAMAFMPQQDALISIATDFNVLPQFMSASARQY